LNPFDPLRLFSKETPVLAHTMQHENKDFRVFRVFRGLFSKETPVLAHSMQARK